MSDALLIHVTDVGDCITSIADQYGHAWQTLWDLPENAALRRLRANPNVLRAGDRVHVIPIRVRAETVASGRRHQFVRRGVPVRYAARFLDEGRPRANVPYRCVIEDKTIRGVTDPAGTVTFAVPPAARTGLLILTEKGVEQRFELRFGHLDPLATVSGIQHRLANLGYACPTTGDLDPDTVTAMWAFRSDFMPATESTVADPLDDAFRAALAKQHGH